MERELVLTEQFAQWKNTLDVPVEHYLECSIPDTDREEIQLSYSEVFNELMQQNKLLRAYRADNASLRVTNDEATAQLKLCKAFLQKASMFINNQELRSEAVQLVRDITN